MRKTSLHFDSLFRQIFRSFSAMKTSRRGFLGASALLTGASALGEESHGSSSKVTAAKPKLGLSTYSYWHFRDPKTPIETVIEKASAFGAHGVDILHRQMDSEERPYLQKLKRTAFVNGVDLICLSIHQDFVDPSAEERQKNIDHTVKCINLAYEM